MLPEASTPQQPFGWTVALSYSATIDIGVAMLLTTKRPTPRSVTNVRRLVASITGPIGALSCRAGPWHGAPLGVVDVAKSMVAAESST